MSAVISAAISYFREKASERKAAIARIDDLVDDLRTLGMRFWGVDGSDPSARPLLFEINAKVQRLSDQLRRFPFDHERERVRKAHLNLKKELTGSDAESATRKGCNLEDNKIAAIHERCQQVSDLMRLKRSKGNVSVLGSQRPS